MPFSLDFEQWILPGNFYHHFSGFPFIYKDSVLFLVLRPTQRQLSKVWELKMFWIKFCCWFLLVHISAFSYKSFGVCVFVSMHVCLCVLACVHILFVIESHIWHSEHVERGGQVVLFVLTFHFVKQNFLWLSFPIRAQQLQMCASVTDFIQWLGIWTIVPNAYATSTSTCWSTFPVPDH